MIGKKYDGCHLSLLRSGISLFLCAYTVNVAKITPVFGHRKNIPLLLSRGAFGAVSMHTYYLSISLLALADAVTIYFLNPTVTAVAAWLILKETLGWTVSVGGQCGERSVLNHEPGKLKVTSLFH